MIKKVIVMLISLALLAAIAPASLADSGGQKHYTGIVGADSPLYGLKVGLQNLDLALTFNNTDKLQKEMNLADERVAEAEDAADENDTGAFDAATGQYSAVLDQIDETSQAEDIDQGVYANLSSMLYHHHEVFYTTTDNPDLALNMTYYIQNRTIAINDRIIKMKNGMPFYYYNGVQYFIPPGQAKKIEKGIIGNTITNGSKVPPGLAKKGFKSATPTITNGSSVWPWDEVPFPTATKTHGNGKSNGNGKK